MASLEKIVKKIDNHPDLSKAAALSGVGICGIGSYYYGYNPWYGIGAGIIASNAFWGAIAYYKYKRKNYYSRQQKPDDTKPQQN